MAKRGKFKIEWYADEVVREMKRMTRQEHRNSARRILQRARKFVPVGGQSNKIGRQRIRSWKSDNPGALKRSLVIRRSKFAEGGYVVLAGTEEKQATHAVFVEYGTIFTQNRKGYRFMKRAIAQEKAYFTRQLRKRLGV